MITDSIGNYLTSIRNAILAHHKVVSVPSSNIKKARKLNIGGEVICHVY